jgi:hypothetical protein
MVSLWGVSSCYRAPRISRCSCHSIARAAWWNLRSSAHYIDEESEPLLGILPQWRAPNIPRYLMLLSFRQPELPSLHWAPLRLMTCVFVAQGLLLLVDYLLLFQDLRISFL